MANEVIKHTFVSSTNESSVPIQNGRILCVSDKAGLSYDVNGHRYTMISPTSDTDSNKVNFTSSDTASPSSLMTMPAVMVSGQTHATLFQKLSIAMRNLRYIISLIGSTDISSMDDGTITGNIEDLHNRVGFIGTQAEVQAAITSGEITEGMQVVITDDYSNSAINASAVIATYETGTTASRAFTAGEYVVLLDGSLYEITGAVAQGANWASASKSSTTVGAQLTLIQNKIAGFGFGTNSEADSTVARTVAITNYKLAIGSTVYVSFTNAVPGSATLNINSTGAKPIYYHGAAITGGIIQAGDTVLFGYTGTNYIVLAVDRTAGALGYPVPDPFRDVDEFDFDSFE